MSKALALAFVYISVVSSFLSPSVQRTCSPLCSSTTSAESSHSSSWQTTLDELLDVDTPCDSRREKLVSLFSKSQDIFSDVSSVVGNGDIDSGLDILAPKSTKYGKAIKGFEAFNYQMVNDILPNLIKNGIPVNPSSTVNPSEVLEIVSKQAPKLVEQVRELASDPSYLQSTRDDLVREVKNVVKSVPEGLQSPAYTVLAKSKQSDIYEVRKYEPFSVCKTEEGTMSTGGQGNSFNILADYIFGGGNVDNYEMSMTTPVIMDEGGAMSFVLTEGMTADTAPIPKNMEINLNDIPSETVAFREFTGIATDAEVDKQKQLLIDSLNSDGIEFDADSLKILQFNPPYTIPWLRLNALTLKLSKYVPEVEAAVKESDEECTAKDMPSDVNIEHDGDLSAEENLYYSSPEAGE